MSSKLTHFLCIPLVTHTSRPLLETSLKTLRNEVRQQRIAEAAIRPVGTLHLTIGVMSLATADAVEAACEKLKQLDIKALLSNDSSGSSNDNDSTTRPQVLAAGRTADLTAPEILSAAGITAIPPDLQIKISLRSLQSMRDPKNTSVLYAYPDDPSHTLMGMCEQLQRIFTDAGFIRPDNRALKLHATIWNGIYAKRAFPGRRKHGSVTIDATSLMDKFKDILWADSFELEKIAICEMRARDVFDEAGVVVDQEYKEVCSLSLPVGGTTSERHRDTSHPSLALPN